MEHARDVDFINWHQPPSEGNTADACSDNE